MKRRMFLARVGGNFGMSFFGPLIGGTVAESLYPGCIAFEHALIISAISALFITGLAVSKEAAAYGEKRTD